MSAPRTLVAVPRGAARILAFLRTILVVTWLALPRPVAAQAILDPSPRVFDLTEAVHGETLPRGALWTLYEDRLVEDSASAGASSAIAAPAHWSRHPLADGRRLPPFGCHTFHGRLKLPPAWLDGRRSLALSFPYQFHASRVIVRNRGPSGGRWEASSGIPACRPSEETPLHRPVRVLFTADGEVDVFIQISNFHAMRGGLVRLPFVGLAEAVIERRLVQERLDFAIVGVLAVAGIVHLAQWLFRRAERHTLYFAMLCLAMAVRATVFGNYLESFEPPLVGFATSQRLVYITIDAAVFFTVAYLDAALPNTLPRFMVRAFAVACGSLSALVLLLDVPTFGPLIFVSEALAAVGSVIVIASGTLAVIRDRSLFAMLTLASFLLLAAAAVFDIVVDSFRLGEFYIAPFGTMGFVVLQAFALAIQNGTARAAADALSAELAARSTRLEQLDELKNEFLATTSHELRTPLNGIVGLSDSLLQRSAIREDREIASHVVAIGDAGRRLTGLIDDILDYSKLRTRKFELDRKPVDLRRVIDQVLLLSRALPGTKPVDLRQSVERGLPFALGDENRLRQILQNLVGNAIKFTDNGFVEVTANAAGALIEVRVRDSGIGIQEDKFEAIFATFEQIDMGPSRRAQGTGLGLAITKQLVELHGGTITVHSAVGLGSTFVFTVPIAAEARASSLGSLTSATLAESPPTPWSEEIDTSAAPRGKSRWRILAVDDDAANLLVLRAQLDAHEFHVTPVRDAQAAVRVFETDGPFDAVLLDVMMPKVSGLEVARELRRIVTSAECPILFLSARTALDDFAAAFGAGGSDFLTKPVVRTELLARLRHHLGVSAAYRARGKSVDPRLDALIAGGGEFVVVAARPCPRGSATIGALTKEFETHGAVATFPKTDVVLVVARKSADDSTAEALEDALRRVCGPMHFARAAGHVTLESEAPRDFAPRLAGPAVVAALDALPQERDDASPFRASADR